MNLYFNRNMIYLWKLCYGILFLLQMDKGNVKIWPYQPFVRPKYQWTTSGVSKAPWVEAKSLVCQKNPAKVYFFCWNCVSILPIMRASYQSLSSPSLLHAIICAIRHFSPLKDNTKETRSCPIVLGRQHDYVKSSQYYCIDNVYYSLMTSGLDRVLSTTVLSE